MSLIPHFQLLAAYNQWMNSKVYEAANQLNAADLIQDRGAFFGSIFGTLNHIVVGDTIWLKRFAKHPSCSISLGAVAGLPDPLSMNQLVFDNFQDLSKHRTWLDKEIIEWIGTLTEDDMSYVLSYGNTKGVPASKLFSNLLLHFFNHQTHHRGQVSTLLSQAGVDIGVTDLLVLLPQEPHA